MNVNSSRHLVLHVINVVKRNHKSPMFVQLKRRGLVKFVYRKICISAGGSWKNWVFIFFKNGCKYEISWPKIVLRWNKMPISVARWHDFSNNDHSRILHHTIFLLMTWKMQHGVQLTTHLTPRRFYFYNFLWLLNTDLVADLVFPMLVFDIYHVISW